MSATTSLIQNLSVRTKLFSGFALVLLILIISSVMSYNALDSMSSRFDVVNDVREANLLISEARHADKDFLLQNDPMHLQQAISISTQATLGEEVVQKTIKQIKSLAHEVTTSANSLGELKEQSNTIGSVLDVIKSIADQTNLLALNAAIEAARAGEAGRGFSVVAEEVRALAFRTQESTGQIEQLISALQQKAEAAVSNMHKSSGLADNTLESADDAGDAIQAINMAVSSIQQMNQQIAAAALQQSTVAEEINRSIFSIRDVAEQSATASEETAAASNDLSRLGTELQQLASQFKVA